MTGQSGRKREINLEWPKANTFIGQKLFRLNEGNIQGGQILLTLSALSFDLQAMKV